MEVMYRQFSRQYSAYINSLIILYCYTISVEYLGLRYKSKLINYVSFVVGMAVFTVRMNSSSPGGFQRVDELPVTLTCSPNTTTKWTCLKAMESV